MTNTDTPLERELIALGKNYIADLASVTFPTSEECARCVIHAVQDAGYIISKGEPRKGLGDILKDFPKAPTQIVIKNKP